MGSGFSGCTGASSVGVTEVGGKQSLNKSGGGVHSDSCDSGISIGDGNKKSRSSYRHTATSRHVAGELDSEEEMMVAGSEVGCGTDFLMTSTPRARATTTTASTTKLADVAEHPDTMSPSHTPRKSRNAHPRSRTSSLRHNPNSEPNLLEHAIHEEDEDAFDGEPEDKRLRAQRPPRPKSAHFRKSRAGNSQRGRTARSRQHNQHVGSASGGDSSAEVTSDEGEDDFDSDILSIPDETSPHVTRPNTLTTIRLGPQFQAQTKIQDHDGHDNDKNEDMDWWAEDDGGSTARTSRDGGIDSSRSQASSSFTLRSHSRVWPEGRVAKKASERSISSILLTTAVELDSSPATAATNPACFAVTNPEITQHILKVSTSMQAATIATCMRNLIESSSSTSIPPVATFQTNVKNHDRARSLNQKLHDIFVVKPAKEPVKGPEPSLEQKLRDLFIVREVKTPEQQLLEEKLQDLSITSSDESDGSRAPRGNRKPRRQTLVINAGITENIRNTMAQKKLKSLLVSTNSESAIDPQPLQRLKKTVSFSPDIPDSTKCSKTYRMQRIAMIAARLGKVPMTRKMRNAARAKAIENAAANVKTSNNAAANVKTSDNAAELQAVNKASVASQPQEKLSQLFEKAARNYQCFLCQKDCIKRIMY